MIRQATNHGQYWEVEVDWSLDVGSGKAHQWKVKFEVGEVCGGVYLWASARMQEAAQPLDACRYHTGPTEPEYGEGRSANAAAKEAAKAANGAVTYYISELVTSRQGRAM